jgi:heme exporter protein D
MMPMLARRHGTRNAAARGYDRRRGAQAAVHREAVPPPAPRSPARIASTTDHVDTLVEFLRMGGYAFYVWLSYGIVALLLAINVIVPLRRHRRLCARLRRELAREGRAPSARGD